MSLEDVRKRLPVVGSLPRGRGRAILPLAPGERPKPRLAVWELTLRATRSASTAGHVLGERGRVSSTPTKR
jgi:hypothetical protein